MADYYSVTVLIGGTINEQDLSRLEEALAADELESDASITDVIKAETQARYFSPSARWGEVPKVKEFAREKGLHVHCIIDNPEGRMLEVVGTPDRFYPCNEDGEPVITVKEALVILNGEDEQSNSPALGSALPREAALAISAADARVKLEAMLPPSLPPLTLSKD